MNGFVWDHLGSVREIWELVAVRAIKVGLILFILNLAFCLFIPQVVFAQAAKVSKSVAVGAELKSVKAKQQTAARNFILATSLKSEIEKRIDVIVDSYSTEEMQNAHSGNGKSKEAYLQSVAKFKADRNKIVQEVLSSIEDDLEKIFTLEELEYLVTFSKYRLFKKLDQYLNSNEFQSRSQLPFKKMRTLVEGPQNNHDNKK